MQPGHSTYLGISKENHDKNIRTMHVNAQVTAVTTLLEFIGNCLIVILYVLMGSIPQFIGFALFMQLHFVSLSYAFLMNTRYNKNRIVEYGWKNVWKNILYCGSEHSATTLYHSSQESNLPPNSTNKKKSDEKCGKNGVFTIYNKALLDSIKEMNHKHMEEIDIFSNNQPRATTSKGQDFENTISSTENDKISHCKKSIKRIRFKFLSNLSLHIYDEDNYTSILMRFVQLEEEYKNGQDVNNINYQANENTVINLPHFVGTLQRKFEMRTSSLEKLMQHCKNDNNEVYDEHFNQFIDMEENFLENGC